MRLYFKQRFFRGLIVMIFMMSREMQSMKSKDR